MKINDESSQYTMLMKTALQHQQNADQLQILLQNYCPTAASLGQLSLEEENELVMETKGQLGSLFAAMRLGQLVLTAQPVNYGTAYSSKELGQTMMKRLAKASCEEVVIACTNIHNEIIALKTMFRGGQAECHVYPEEILRYALKSGAHGVIMVHNHPSGSPQPSECDLKLMKRLASACSIVGLHLLDCLITGRTDYYSMREEENRHHAAG